jgi:hypothetical protein
MNVENGRTQRFGVKHPGSMIDVMGSDHLRARLTKDVFHVQANKGLVVGTQDRVTL